MWTALRRLATGLAVSLCAPAPTAAQAAPSWVPGTYRVVVCPSGACQTAAALRRATHGILVLGSAADFAFLSDSAHAILRTEWDMRPLNGCLEWVAVARHDASYAGANPHVGVVWHAINSSRAITFETYHSADASYRIELYATDGGLRGIGTSRWDMGFAGTSHQTVSATRIGPTAAARCATLADRALAARARIRHRVRR
jgi:hypothetical protein